MFGPACPIRVERASMIHRWDQLTFLHWGFDPEVVQRLLPTGLTVETFHGRAWVGLVPFLMQARPARGPAVPWISNFCETNVRTYATAPDGTNGVWFLSLDAARLPAVIAGRTTYQLPYYWSRMRLESAEALYHYTSRRRWPGPTGTTSDVRVEVGDRFGPDELTEFDHFLTARWRLYSTARNGLRSALAEHEPWLLHRASVLDLDDELFSAAGLPSPHGDAIAHWSPGVEVRIGFPHKIRG